jgi:hypothetical protein
VVHLFFPVSTKTIRVGFVPIMVIPAYFGVSESRRLAVRCEVALRVTLVTCSFREQWVTLRQPSLATLANDIALSAKAVFLRGGNMRICGVQIAGSTANLAVVSPDDAGGVIYHPCHTKKISLEDEKSGDSLRTFLKAITAFAHENQVEGFCIKQRASGGQHGAGGPSFKVEALVQLVPDTPTYFANPVALSKFAKTNLAGLPYGLQRYLEDAYRSGAFQLKKLGAV